MMIMLPSQEIAEIVRRLDSGDKVAEVITPTQLSNVLQAVIHFLDHQAMIEDLKNRKEVKS